MVTCIYDHDKKEYLVIIGEDKYVFDSYIMYKAFMEGVITVAARHAKTPH